MIIEKMFKIKIYSTEFSVDRGLMKLVLASASCVPSYLGSIIFWSKISITHEAEGKSLLFSGTKRTECQEMEEFPSDCGLDVLTGWSLGFIKQSFAVAMIH